MNDTRIKPLSHKVKRYCRAAIRRTVDEKTPIYIFALAQYAQEICPSRYKPFELFNAMALYAEAEVNDVNLAIWLAYKGRILSAMRRGLAAADYESEAELADAAAAFLDTQPLSH